MPSACICLQVKDNGAAALGAVRPVVPVRAVTVARALVACAVPRAECAVGFGALFVLAGGTLVVLVALTDPIGGLDPRGGGT